MKFPFTVFFPLARLGVLIRSRRAPRISASRDLLEVNIGCHATLRNPRISPRYNTRREPLSVLVPGKEHYSGMISDESVSPALEAPTSFSSDIAPRLECPGGDVIRSLVKAWMALGKGNADATEISSLLDLTVRHIPGFSIQPLSRLVFCAGRIVSAGSPSVSTQAFLACASLRAEHLLSLYDDCPPRVVSKFIVGFSLLGSTSEHHPGLWTKLVFLATRVAPELDPSQVQQIAFGLWRAKSPKPDTVLADALVHRVILNLEN